MVPYPLGWMQDRGWGGPAPPRQEPPGSPGVRQPARGREGPDPALGAGEQLE